MRTILLGILDQGSLGRVFVPERFPVRVGRDPDNDLVLSDRSVSRHHCLLAHEGGISRVLDHASINGTFVNGRSVEQEVLRSGDVLRAGSIEIVFVDVAEVQARRGNELRALQEENRYLWKILRFNREILRESERSRLLEGIVDTAVALTRAERGFLLLFRNGDLNFETARDHERRDIADPAGAISRSIVEEVRRTAEPVQTTDATEDPRFGKHGSIHNLMLRSVLCVPLRTGEASVIGVLYIDNRIQRGAFAIHDARLLAGFADQAAMAIRNSDLHAESLRREEELRRSHEEIRRLNRDLEAQVRRQSVELAEVRGDLRKKQEELEFQYNYQNIVGRSPAMRNVFRLLDKIIPSTVSVLIVGESGTGKELVARVIHFNGPRKEKPFVSENCASIPATLLESELFGHEKGAFTGAEHRSAGLFETAHGGTLFLDEIGDMSLDMQKRLLRVLQEGEIRKVGGSEIQKIDVRLISATNRNLEELKDRGLFREDLFYRLNVVQVNLPPLRDRREDVPLLVDHFLEKVARESGGERKRISVGALQCLLEYSWPGNVRELENEIRKMVALSEGEIRQSHLSARIRGLPMAWGEADEGPGSSTASLREVTERVEADLIRRTLEDCSGNKSEVARRLGLSRPGLRKKMVRYGIGGGREDERGSLGRAARG
jgi:transcriptional regulator with GAF, ATPase, and Fis domain